MLEQRRRRQEEGEAERSCYVLSAAPIPSSLHHSVAGGGKEAGNEAVKLRAKNCVTVVRCLFLCYSFSVGKKLN